jgi:activator of 2-hydroxyglutaryl-CoA dehydratase
MTQTYRLVRTANVLAELEEAEKRALANIKKHMETIQNISEVEATGYARGQADAYRNAARMLREALE